jgi:acyl dehydratase
MDGDRGWSSRHTRFLGEVYVGDTLEVKYVISDKKEDKGYGILAIDFEINRADDKKLSWCRAGTYTG